MSRTLRSRGLALAAAAGALLASTAAVGPTSTTPNDTFYGQQWGPQQVRAPQAWATSTGSGATIAIVDSGVDLSHDDLAKNVRKGKTFLDCGDSGCGDGDWESKEGAGHPHGTHVAGIAAAEADNGTGIAGVAPDATILPVKVLDENGSGSFADVARGIRWAADNGADVINLSLGALPGVQALEITGLVSDAVEAIGYARAQGVVVVAAAGNEAFPLCGSPSFTDGALCVTATDVFELRAAYSNEPLKPDLKALAAPGGSAAGTLVCGQDILSTVPEGEGYEFCGYTSDYEEYAGTSMAAPHVAGVAALLTSVGCSATQTEELLLSTARNPVTGLRGFYDPVYGYGIADAEASVTGALSICSSSASTGDTDTGNGNGGGNGNGNGGGNGGGKRDKG